MTAAAHVLMCPPDYYAIEYEINPWMHCNRPCDRRLAGEQWQGLRHLLEKLGAAVSCLSPVAGLPDLVFTANAALIHGETAIVSHFRYPERQAEESHFCQWLGDHGFRTQQLRNGTFFEGAGDALFCGDTLFAGYRFRSEVAALHEIGQMLECRVIPLELVRPRFYHLDTCFCPLAPDVAIYFPDAFDEYGRKALQESVGQLIAVEEDEAQQFACNAVVVGRAVITNTGCPKLHRELHRLGLTTYETPLQEFVKAGGSAKCLTLRLDGEEAAGWKGHHHLTTTVMLA